MGPTPPVADPGRVDPADDPPVGRALSDRPLGRPPAGRRPEPDDRRGPVLILGALAERQAARALLLPYLNAGTNYHDHTGPLQRSNGTILKLTEQSLYFGGGARTVAAESVAIPAVNIFSPLTDAIFEPLAAQQRVVGARFNASDTANKVLLDVASLYIDLIGAEAILEARRVTAAESDRIADARWPPTPRPARGGSPTPTAPRPTAGSSRSTSRRPRSGSPSPRPGWPSGSTSTPRPSSEPLAGPLEPLELIDPETPPEELIRAAVTRRPDLAAREALVSQAEYRVRQEKARPLLPTIWLGFSGGAFGGGSNLTATPLGALRRPDRLRRPGLLDGPQPGRRQRLADQAAQGPGRPGDGRAVAGHQPDPRRGRLRPGRVAGPPVAGDQRPVRAPDRRGGLPAGPDPAPRDARAADRGPGQPPIALRRPGLADRGDHPGQPDPVRPLRLAGRPAAPRHAPGRVVRARPPAAAAVGH